MVYILNSTEKLSASIDLKKNVLKDNHLQVPN